MNLKKYGPKTFLAIINPFQSVERVFPSVFDQITKTTKGYFGTKNVAFITPELIQFLQAHGFLHHTIDKASLGGRAVDLTMQNPISGRPMTGSSSGTALNVFLGINDFGLGTDGGGSVLAPAMALNLLGMIHPSFNRFSPHEEKLSTDGIHFVPSVGVITKEFQVLENLLLLFNEDVTENPKFFADNLKLGLDREAEINIDEDSMEVYSIDLAMKYDWDRNEMISHLTSLMNEYDIIISKEGPVDCQGMGDSIFGHFDGTTSVIQRSANKGLLKVVNMCHLVGLTVPSQEFAVGYLLICSPHNKRAIAVMMDIARSIYTFDDELLSRYFGNYYNYWNNGISV